MESYVGKEMGAAEVDVPLRGTFSGDPFEAPTPPPPFRFCNRSSSFFSHLARHSRIYNGHRNELEGGTAVTAKFPGLLPEFAPHVNEIGRCMGFVVGDAVIPIDENRTISIRMVLYPSLAKNPPQFISLPTIHGGEILQRVFFIGLPGRCFVCGRKDHVAAACTRRRISPDQRQQASKQEALHANGGLEDRLVRRRSEAEKARRKGRKDDDELRRQRIQSLCIGNEKMFLLSPQILLHHLFMIRHPILRAQVWISAVLKAQIQPMSGIFLLW
ncbi:hypothetical protein L7F22_023938 [Adiantum nelumboides]|nr:hypothetical protein [Adiantum nelumboides]